MKIAPQLKGELDFLHDMFDRIDKVVDRKSRHSFWDLHERLNNWAGGIDTYAEIHRIAREVPADMLPENVEPRRWWKA